MEDVFAVVVCDSDIDDFLDNINVNFSKYLPICKRSIEKTHIESLFLAQVIHSKSTHINDTVLSLQILILNTNSL